MRRSPGKSREVPIAAAPALWFIRESRWRIARYYDAEGRVPSRWELYNLQRDPLERRNLAHRATKCTPHQQREFKRLKRKLALVERTRLRPLP